MKPIREANSLRIEWRGKWEYLLRSGEDVVGMLHVQNHLGTRALAESADGVWIFEKRWFPFEKVTLRQADSNKEIAVFKSKLKEKINPLEFSFGLKYYWVPANVWRTQCVFTDAYGHILVHFSRDSNPFIAFALPKGHSTGRADIERSVASMPDIPLLTFLGCYLMVQESI